MPFKKVLNEILEAVPEALGAIIVDYEGESVQYVSKIDEHEIKVVGAYQVIFLDAIKKLFTAGRKRGNANAFTTKADEMDIISMRIDDDYSVCLILAKDSLLATAEFTLRNKLEDLKRIM